MLADIKKKIKDWADDGTITLVFAATTGLGVKSYLDFIREHRLRVIAVTAPRLGHPRWKPFDSRIRQQIEELGGVVIEERAIWAILRVAPMLIAKYIVPLFGYKEKNWEELLAVGGRVCLQITEIAIKKSLIKEGETVIAISGESTALALRITSTKPAKMALLDIILRSEIEL